ncbi:aminoglycoside phosphotransferase [Iodidimonas nitroreducens]|uniref:Aminoglycoside phosphotransferase n=1 Tax=Iodidimonas nitroreducens TaxID=1236968 RepID=A0A5A7NAR3_9PROT|nr:phosphotransferase [Iodidimonas nitroreducens]GAK34219.1 acyl-CoA dehydrogenase family member 10 [alpha proteobacterium Q-1]GER05007.1 aminoglycoside phosphotransferase [Iodidimonas nitroreducens]
MTSRQETFSGTMDVRERHRFDEAALDAYMAAHVAGYSPGLHVEQFKGGQSNPTYRLIDGAGKRYVLRRKPPGVLLKSAHAVDREYRVVTALGQKTRVPVARTHALCTDETVIGTWFYIMDYVEGRIFWDAAIPQVENAERAALFDAMNATIAALHSVDHEAIGLGDYGKPGNYFARQIARWAGQYEQDEDAGRFDAMDRLVKWLPENIPPGDETTIVHGDFRIDNMIFHPTEPRVLAILDWELSTLGHPLADFSYHLMMYRMPPTGFTGLLGADLAALNIPSEKDYIARYCARTGRDPIPDHDMNFYVAFNMFRLAAILHGIRGRVKRGTAASKHAEAQGQMCGPLADLAWSQIHKG